MVGRVTYTFRFPGLCVLPKQSVRRGRYGFYKDPRIQLFEKKLSNLYSYEMQKLHLSAPLSGPLAIDIMVGIKRPKSVKREYPTVRPDTDNLSKGVKDAANKILFKDDGQIVDERIRKVYADEDYLLVTLTEL